MSVIDDIDILIIDKNIKSTMEPTKEKITQLKEDISTISLSIERSKNGSEKVKKQLDERLEMLTTELQDIESCKILNFYIMDTIELLEKYKEKIKEPIKIIPGKKNKTNKELQKIINDYLCVIEKYGYMSDSHRKHRRDRSINTTETNSDILVICNNCGNKKKFDVIDDVIFVCNICFAQQTIITNQSTYNDIGRVNMYNQYTYKKEIHFKDCIKQYQGKQNYIVPDHIYSDLTRELQNHRILIDSDDNTVKFSKVTKKQIMMFLEDLNYPEQYENIHMIHYNLTGIHPDNISYLEDSLIKDFEMLVDAYDKLFGSTNGRKNFINAQYVLYQLLVKHKHPCDKNNFALLKTITTRKEHDNICKILFEYLGWNFTNSI